MINKNSQTKYIFVSGGVISGLGKGVTAASIALILQSKGFKVAPIKCENYLNVDAGTINPIEHGDPFLCEDGTEADMDIGTYEKFLDLNLDKQNFITMGQIYKTVIDKERSFEYQGEDVEAIPHITDEIQQRWINVAEKNKPDFVIIELGGTAGEYQNVFYYEASRILAFNNPGRILHVHVGYMPRPAHLGEPKTKPIQLSVKFLNSMGIQPDMIVVRSDVGIDQRRKDRFSLFCNVLPQDIFSAPDLKIVYDSPLVLEKQNLGQRIMEKFNLKPRKKDLKVWEDWVTRVKKIKQEAKTLNLAIVGKYFVTGGYQLRDSYAALFDALEHAAWHNNINLNIKWIDAESLEKEGISNQFNNICGIIVPIGWGERGAEGMIAAAGFARDKKIPYLGLCYGMQLAVVSFARDVLGLKNANTTEVNPSTKHPVVHLIPDQERIIENRAYGGSMRLGAWQAKVKKSTLAWKAYEMHKGFKDKGREIVSERHRHRWEFNNEYAKEFEKHGFVFSARSVKENLVEIIELPKDKHPFYLGTQGHPEYKSRPLSPHPLFIEFVKACINKS